MTSSRFSLRFLFASMALLAVACAALRYPTTLCLTAVFSGVLLLLALAAVGVVTTRGAARAFCLGFLIVGGMHEILAFTQWMSEGTSHILVTRYCLDQLAGPLGYAMPTNAFIEEKTVTVAMANFVPGSPPAIYYKYIVIGQSLFTLFLGLAGGVAGRRWHRQSFPAEDA